MGPWVRVLGALAAIVVGALLLRLLPPLLVLAMVIGVFWFVAARLRAAERADRPTGAELLGLKREASDPFGLTAYPLQLFTRSASPAIDELVWGTWRGLEVRVFGTSFRAPSLQGQPEARSSFAAALVLLDDDLPALVVEPQVFVTAFERAPALERASARDAAFDEVWGVWASDPGDVSRILGADLRAWLASLGGRWGLELCGRMAVLYGSQPERPDVVGVLELLRELVDLLPPRTRAAPPPAVREDRSAERSPGG